MIVTYDVYRRYAERDREKTGFPISNDIYYGKRYEIISDFQSISITLNWKKRSKFSIKGKAVKRAPFIIGDTIIIYRNAELLFTGIIDTVNIKCNDVTSESIEWEASGVDEGEIFDRRIILTEYVDEDGQKIGHFKDLTFHDKQYDKIGTEEEGVYAYDRMIYYMKNCFDGTKTLKDRAISDLVYPLSSDDDNIPVEKRGEKGMSAYRLKKLSNVLEEIGEDANLYPQFQWDPITGKKKIYIPFQRDLSGMTKDEDGNIITDGDIVVVSPEFGNVSKWSVKHTLPKFNAVWVCSGEYTEIDDEEDLVKLEKVYDEDKKLIGYTFGAWCIDLDEEGVVKKFYVDDEKQAEIDAIEAERAQRREERKRKQKNQDEPEESEIPIEDEPPKMVYSYSTRVWVYAEDKESIAKYGRIEQVITKSDIKMVDDDEETEEDETLTAEDVIKLLKEEATKALQENAAKDKYTITLAETEELVFMRDWKCGDIVKVVIDGKEFQSSIETVSITYSDNNESVSPTLGAVEEGVFSEIFDMISGIDKRLESEEAA